MSPAEPLSVHDLASMMRYLARRDELRPYMTSEIVHRNSKGEILDVRRLHNLITTIGHAAANGRITNQGGYSPFVNIAIGIGTAAAAIADTALGSESSTVGAARGAATATQVTTTTLNDTAQLVKTFTFSGSLAITEEGVFDSATPSSGTMMARQVFAAINVVSGDSCQFSHKILS